MLPILPRSNVVEYGPRVPSGPELFKAGFKLYSQRQDKDWTLTGYISFVVMERMRIREVLTGDYHFEQAGLTVLLK